MSYVWGYLIVSLFFSLSVIIAGWRNRTPQETEHRNEEEIEWQRHHYEA